jgi:hypothetical protein
MTALIIDVAQDVTAKLPGIKAAGIKTIFGYLSSINPNGAKCLTPSRVRAIAAAGLRVGLVHEGYGGVGGKGISAADGDRDGRFARVQAPALGAPNGTCVYFACDTDFSPAQIRSLVIPYFAEVRKALADGYFRVGVYGSGAVCAAVRAANLADLSWEAGSKGWTGYSDWVSKADMVQTVDANVGGVADDSDVANGDIGDYVPFAASPSIVPAAVPVAHVPTQPELDAAFTAARARINSIAGSWASWISDDAVRQVVSDALIAADKAGATS